MKTTSSQMEEIPAPPRHRPGGGSVLPYVIFFLAVAGGLGALMVGFKITESERAVPDTHPIVGETSPGSTGTRAAENPGAVAIEVGAAGKEAPTSSGGSTEYSGGMEWIEVEPLPEVAREKINEGWVKRPSPNGRSGSSAPARPSTSGAEGDGDPEPVVTLADSVVDAREMAEKLDAERWAPKPYYRGVALAETAGQEAANNNREAADYLYERANQHFRDAINESAIGALRGDVVGTGIPLEEVAKSPVWRKILKDIEVGRSNIQSGAIHDGVALIELARQEIPEIRVQYLDRKRTEARAAVSGGQTAAAMALYRQILELEPEDAEAEAFFAQNRYLPGERLETAAGFEWAFVPAGRFRQGSPPGEPGREADESPHDVVIEEGFFIGVTEVTQEQWIEIMGKMPTGFSDAPAATVGPSLPVHSVTWEEAVAFCRRLSNRIARNVRLPTESEWEYAIRGGTETAFATGRNHLEPGEGNVAFRERRRPRILLPALEDSGGVHPLGLLHVHGNLWEWTGDAYRPYPNSNHNDAENSTPATAQFLAGMKVLRGGSYMDPPELARSANRWARPADAANPYIGFRVLMELDYTTFRNK